MNDETKNLSAQESLDLITSMINQAKGNLRQNSFFFLLWGWTILFCNAGVYVMLKFLAIRDPWWIWILTILAALISGIYGRNQERKGPVTHLDRISMWLWIGFGIMCFTIVAFGSRINYQINGVIVCMSAVPTFLSGIILRFKPLIIGGICFWVFGVIIFLISGPEQFLVSAIAIATGYLVPGYMLRAKKA